MSSSRVKQSSSVYFGLDGHTIELLLCRGSTEQAATFYLKRHLGTPTYSNLHIQPATRRVALRGVNPECMNKPEKEQGKESSCDCKLWLVHQAGNAGHQRSESKYNNSQFESRCQRSALSKNISRGEPSISLPPAPRDVVITHSKVPTKIQMMAAYVTMRPRNRITQNSEKPGLATSRIHTTSQSVPSHTNTQQYPCYQNK
ncbi:hypothetical protein BGZ63DRAFT_398624 [Mariannaea sp. PMI_226]|nr:hypothetical protein BGZ63DRAFT_398624 [Mariannaea sp. PMI_226]